MSRESLFGRSSGEFNTSVTEREKSAHRSTVRTPLPDAARQMQTLIGQKATAAIVGVFDPKVIGKWARGEAAPRMESAVMLMNLLHYTRLISPDGDRSVVIANLFTNNPQLNYHSPAEVLQKDPRAAFLAASDLIREEI